MDGAQPLHDMNSLLRGRQVYHNGQKNPINRIFEKLYFRFLLIQFERSLDASSSGEVVPNFDAEEQILEVFECTKQSQHHQGKYFNPIFLMLWW